MNFQPDACMFPPVLYRIAAAMWLMRKRDGVLLRVMQPRRKRRAPDNESNCVGRSFFNDATQQWESYEPRSGAGAAAGPSQPSEDGAAAAAAPSLQQAAATLHASPDGSASDGSSDSDSSDDADAPAPSTPLDEALAALDLNSAQLLAVGGNKRQGVWLVRYRLRNQRKWRISFLGLRLLKLSDGEELIGYSCGCPCGADTSVNATLEGQDRLGQPRSWLTAARMCPCGRRLVQHLGGSEAVQLLFCLAPISSDTDNIVQQHSIGGSSYHVVRAGDAFADWGAVSSLGRCCTCPSRQWLCRHVAALPATAEIDRLPTMSAADFERKLDKEFDLVAGCCRLPCIAQPRLPEELQEDAALQRLIVGAGTAAMTVLQHRSMHACFAVQ